MGMIPERLLCEIRQFVKTYNIHHVCFEVDPQVYIIFIDYPIPSNNFAKDKTDVLILSTTSYPATAFDMFFTPDDIKLRDGTNPEGATPANQFGGGWTQWSIHPYQNNPWDPNNDDLISFMSYVNQRFVNGD